nr:large subunit ribosomal protein L3 [Vacuolaria virescens]
MTIGILGLKVGMTQIFDKNGLAIPISVIKAGPCIVTQIKNVAENNYNAIQIGFLEKKNIKKPEFGHFQKSGAGVLKFLKEYKVKTTDNFKIGQVINVDLFTTGQLVTVRGKTIGKGFTGLQKRYHFARGPMTHGSKNHRAPGSIGAGTTPGRVFPNKKMSGQKGNQFATISGLTVIAIDIRENLLLVKGGIPGKSGNFVSIIPSLS